MNNNIIKQNQDSLLLESTKTFLQISQKYDYSKNMSWLGMQTMQYPEDLLALQDILWRTKPSIVIATGVANGGTLVFISSIMHSYMNLPLIIGIDPFVSNETKQAICTHMYGNGIHLIEASSTDSETVLLAKEIISNKQSKESIMVILDSMHETEHVTKELLLWKDMVSVNCYLVVCWTIIGECDDEVYKNKQWGNNSNPLIAVNDFLIDNPNYLMDNSFERKYLITTSGKGYLKRIF